MLTRKFTPQTVNKTSVIIVQETCKLFLAILMLIINGDFRETIKGWSPVAFLHVAALPAFLYSIQNICALLAYQNLDGVTYNVLNQTKTLSAALCCYLLMGRKQSNTQILALLLLLGSALIIENIISIDFVLLGGWLIGSQRPGKQEGHEAIMGGETMTSSGSNRRFTHGVIPVLAASFLSGLAGAICQKNLQGSSGTRRSQSQSSGRNPFLFSAELCAASILFLSLSLLSSEDGKAIQEYGFFHRWRLGMLIPIVTNSVGGIVVGLVTKYAGSVMKGFSLIFGVLLTGVIQSLVKEDGNGVSPEQIVGGVIAALSLWMHTANPRFAVKTKILKRD